MGSKGKVKLLKWKRKVEKQQITWVPLCFKTIPITLRTGSLLATQVNRKIQRFVLFGFDFAQVCPNTHEVIMHNRSFGPVLI